MVCASLCSLQPVQLLKEIKVWDGVKSRKLPTSGGSCIGSPQQLCKFETAECVLTFHSFFNSISCLYLNFFLVRARFSVEVTPSNMILWRSKINREKQWLCLVWVAFFLFFACLPETRVNAVKAVVFCFGGLFGKNLSYSEFVEQLK